MIRIKDKIKEIFLKEFELMDQEERERKLSKKRMLEYKSMSEQQLEEHRKAVRKRQTAPQVHLSTLIQEELEKDARAAEAAAKAAEEKKIKKLQDKEAIIKKVSDLID